MKPLYSTLNEGILDVDDVIDQLEDIAELGCLERIFKLIGGVIDKQRQFDNTWQPASPFGRGKEVMVYPDRDKYQELLKLIHQFIGFANSLKITPERSEVINENPKVFITGHVHEIQERFKLELLIPLGSKFVLYSIVSEKLSKDCLLTLTIQSVDPTKRRRWMCDMDINIVKNMLNSNNGNFAIPYDATTKKKVKGFLYKF